MDVEEWESLLWAWCTLARRHVCSVIGASKGARPDFKSLRLVGVLDLASRYLGSYPLGEIDLVANR